MMIKRRSFVVGVSTAGASVAVSGAPSLASIGGAATHLGVDESAVSVVLKPVAAVAQDFITSSLENALSATPQVSWATSHPSSWAADNVQMHTRYLPFPDGVALSGSMLAGEIPVGSSGAYWNGRHNAITIDVHAFAVLIDVKKAKERQVSSMSLAGLAKQSVRPYFYVDQTASAPENSWMLPVIAAHVELERPDLTDPRFRQGLTQGVNSLAHLCDSFFDVQIGHGSIADREYDMLIDPGSTRVAMYGDPATLAQRLAVARTGREFGDFKVTSFQEFTGIAAPSIFASTYVQLGRQVEHRSAARLIRAIQSPEIRGALSETGPLSAQTDKSLDACTEALCQAAGSASYRNSRLLPTLLDGGALVNLLTDLAAAKAIGKVQPSNLSNARAFAAARLLERLEDAESLGTMQAMADTAAPEISLA